MEIVNEKAKLMRSGRGWKPSLEIIQERVLEKKPCIIIIIIMEYKCLP